MSLRRKATLNMNARIPSNFRQLAFAAAAGALIFSAEAANTKEKAPKNPVYAPQAKVSDARFQEALEFIVQKMKPDEKLIEGRMAQLDTKSGSGQKLGVERFRARYDKSPQYAMACLALGQNLEEANALLLEMGQVLCLVRAGEGPSRRRRRRDRSEQDFPDHAPSFLRPESERRSQGADRRRSV